jgi:hypothetical protein
MIVKVTAGSVERASLYLRQTPGSKGMWGGIQFFVNAAVEKCDWWFICHGSSLREEDSAICDPSHIVFMSMEPTEWNTPQAFYNQFSKVVLCDRRVRHNSILYQNVTTWWAGINVGFDGGHKISPQYSQDYDSFKRLLPPQKAKRISIVTSRNNSFPGHAKRLEFLDRLKKHPVSQHIDYFGGYHRPIGDKLDAIWPNKYHLALENSVIEDYWSEKFTDPLLGFALPIYYGCPNINKYFPDDSYISIDIEDFDRSVQILEELIHKDPYESHLPAISAARDLVLDRYNVFQLMSDICKDEPGKKFKTCVIKPAHGFKPPLLARVRSRLRRYGGSLKARVKGL